MGPPAEISTRDRSDAESLRNTTQPRYIETQPPLSSAFLAGPHISGDPVRQLLSLMLKLPRLSLLVTLSSRGPLCSRRHTEAVALCSSCDRCSMLLYTCRGVHERP